ncbi:MAG: hypothetical protein AAFV53_17850 [Myxococcota bacterium]
MIVLTLHRRWPLSPEEVQKLPPGFYVVVSSDADIVARANLNLPPAHAVRVAVEAARLFPDMGVSAEERPTIDRVPVLHAGELDDPFWTYVPPRKMQRPMPTADALANGPGTPLLESPAYVAPHARQEPLIEDENVSLEDLVQRLRQSPNPPPEVQALLQQLQAAQPPDTPLEPPQPALQPEPPSEGPPPELQALMAQFYAQQPPQPTTQVEPPEPKPKPKPKPEPEPGPDPASQAVVPGMEIPPAVLASQPPDVQRLLQLVQAERARAPGKPFKPTAEIEALFEKIRAEREMSRQRELSFNPKMMEILNGVRSQEAAAGRTTFGHLFGMQPAPAPPSVQAAEGPQWSPSQRTGWVQPPSPAPESLPSESLPSESLPLEPTPAVADGPWALVGTADENTLKQAFSAYELDQAGAERLVDMMTAESDEEGMMGLRIVRWMKWTEAATLVQRQLHRGPPDRRIEAAKTLAGLVGRAAEAQLTIMARDPNKKVSDAARRVLRRITGNRRKL